MDDELDDPDDGDLFDGEDRLDEDDGFDYFELPGGYHLMGPYVPGGHLHLMTLAAPGILTDGNAEYPLLDGIPYLVEASTRPGLEDARARACAHVRAGDERAALRLLLRDQDRFSPTPPPTEAAVDELLDRRDELTLREAMALLNYGAVGDYFAHRWSSPTFQSGMAILERACLPSRPVVEVGCGIGHFLRVLQDEGYVTLGMDVVFSKLWLARHFLGVRGALVCADVEGLALPLPAMTYRERRLPPQTIFCHDVFYFLKDKPQAYWKLRTLANDGTIALGHVHTRTDAHEAGFAERLNDYRNSLLKEARFIDDGSLACAYVTREGDGEDATEGSAAFAVIKGRKLRKVAAFLPPREKLRLNPLLTPAGIAYPSEGWRAEFEADSASLGDAGLPAFAKTRRVRALLNGETAIDDLSDEEVASLYRHRVLLNLPARW